MARSGLLQRQAKREQLIRTISRQVARQEMADWAIIVLHEEFGFGPDRNKKVLDFINQGLNEEEDLAESDTKDLEYTREVHERRIREAAGKYYVPRNIRYGYKEE